MCSAVAVLLCGPRGIVILVRHLFLPRLYVGQRLLIDLQSKASQSGKHFSAMQCLSNRCLKQSKDGLDTTDWGSEIDNPVAEEVMKRCSEVLQLRRMSPSNQL